MAIPEKDLRLIRKKFEDKSEKIPEKIRLGNFFVDDFIFDDYQAADIPINALRVIFNIISIISNEHPEISTFSTLWKLSGNCRRHDKKIWRSCRIQKCFVDD